MKNYLKIMMIFVALIGMLSLTSCEPENTPVGAATQELTINNSASSFNLALVDVEVLSPEAIEINENLPLLDPDTKNPNLGKRIDLGPLTFALVRLNLTPDQTAQIAKIAQEYKDCITLATKAIRDAEKAIMEQLRADIKAIMDEVKAGTKDKAAAREEIKALQNQAREAIKNIPGREEAQAAVKDCYTKYLEAVKKVLTQQQLDTLTKILTGKGTGSGGGTGGGKVVKIDGPLGPTLMKLGLNEDQSKRANEIAKAYKDCYEKAMAPIQEQEKAIMEALKKQQESLAAALKAGKITREEYAQRMQEAEAAAKEAMSKIPGREEAQAAAKKCYDIYLGDIKKILTPDQLAQLEKILATGGSVGTKP